jgi:hypothetical protein
MLNAPSSDKFQRSIGYYPNPDDPVIEMSITPLAPKAITEGASEVIVTEDFLFDHWT